MAPSSGRHNCFDYDSARRYSDEPCFIFDIYLLVNHSKTLVFIKALQVISALNEVAYSQQFLSQRPRSLV